MSRRSAKNHLVSTKLTNSFAFLLPDPRIIAFMWQPPILRMVQMRRQRYRKYSKGKIDDHIYMTLLIFCGLWSTPMRRVMLTDHAKTRLVEGINLRSLFHDHCEDALVRVQVRKMVVPTSNEELKAAYKYTIVQQCTPRNNFGYER